MPTGKKQTKKEIKMKRFKDVLTRKQLRDKRSDRDQLRFLDSKGLTATKERNRLKKKIKEEKEKKKENAST